MNVPSFLFAHSWILWLIPGVVILVMITASWGGVSRAPAILRALVLALLLTSLAGPMISQGASEVTTVFVVDRSTSIQDGSADAAQAWVNEALANADVDDSAAIITFGDEPDLTVAPQSASTIADSWADQTPDDGYGEVTDLSSALTLARSIPVGEQRRIVVMSDGAENVGHAVEQADQAALDGVPIDVVSLAGVDPADVRIDQLSGPSTLWLGDDLSLVTSIGAGGGGTGTVELVIDGAVVSSQPVTLNPGQTVLSLSAPDLAAGFHAVAVRVSAANGLDRVIENNEAYLGVVVREQPAALLVAPVGSDPARLQQALSAQGADVTVVTPDAVPARSSELERYDAVLLDNVSAWDLSREQQRTLVAHTRNGHGLIVVGGSASFGPGSYAGTELEAALPVTVKVVDGQQRPSVAVLIVMDKSGSMSYDPKNGSTSKIDLAKTGVVTASSALAQGDQLGVIAFNDEPMWAMPMTTLTGQGDQARVEQAIAPLTSDGGTELYPALQVGYDSLRNVKADVRHIILMSDGKSRGGTRETYAQLVNDIGNDDISLSTVALGSDADLELLEYLSVEGDGRYRVANTPEEIPTITFEEAQSAGSQSVLRGAFTPVQLLPSTILNDIDTASMPAIQGYNFADSRSGAQSVLTSDRGDPLLTKWQFGLGRVVAWTADDGSDFASGWDGWGEYDEFWGNTLRWTLPDPANQAVVAEMSRGGRQGNVLLDTQTADGNALSMTGASVDITDPSGDTRTLEPVEVGPGLSRATFDDPMAGAYRVAVRGGELGDATVTLGGAIPTSPEWLPQANAGELLGQLAQRTGGKLRSLDEPPTPDLFDALSADLRGPGSVEPVWQYPLGLGLSMFVVEIALRMTGGFDGNRFKNRERA
ncbi:MAG: hypothetical protein AVDCRST_MAG43-1992 [uncultured Thermomicrobiales bacterium]|uniref:VWFA domain-containing protein n=1 Tax=uncultured Thermomicrobiales bacterium TaxID=1645740 RepID=A0A6J4UVR1_9BACT|nr:MAG: hypothetical protein AVDCRST_MAG43-1992 [uncultured Thermomicrobiales bacterium]